MAHEITNTDGLYLAVKPGWHGLGTVWPTAVGPAEAQKIAGMGWRVEEEPIYLKRKDIVLGDDDLPVETVREIPVSSHKATVRADNGAVLGIVGDGYHVVQNADLVGLVLDAANAEHVEMESAGTFRGGRDVFMLARMGGFKIGERDTSLTYALFTNSHDGTGALRVLPTSIRVVCANTRRAALASGEAGRLTVTLRHSSGLGERLDDVRTALRGAAKVAEREEEMARALAARSLTPDETSDFFRGVYTTLYGPLPKGRYTDLAQGDKAKVTRAREMAEAWNATLRRESDSLALPVSPWLAANAVTRWIDHERTVRGGDRMYSNILGSAADAKDKVYAGALALVK